MWYQFHLCGKFDTEIIINVIKYVSLYNAFNFRCSVTAAWFVELLVLPRTIFYILTFKRVESKVVKGQEMRADVCNCLFTTVLIGVRLPDILVPYLHCSEVCKLVPVNKGMCVRSTSTVLLCALTRTESKRARLVLLRSRGQERLTCVIRQRWEKFDWVWSRGAAEGSAGRNRFSPCLLISGPHCRQNSLGQRVLRVV